MLVVIRNLFEEDAVVEPRQLCSNLLHRFIVSPDLREGRHMLEVADRKAFDVWKLVPQVSCQPIDDFGTSASLCCLWRDVAVDLPIRKMSSRLTATEARRLRRPDAALQVCEELW